MIPLEISNRFPVVPVLLPGGPVISGLLDSSSPLPTVLRDSRPRSFALGTAVLRVVPRPAVDAARALLEWDVVDRLVGRKIGAILGRDVFERFDVLLDIARGRIRIEDEIGTEGLTTAPLRSWLVGPRVEVSVGGRPVVCALATGASHTCLRSDHPAAGALRATGETVEDHDPSAGGWFEADLHVGELAVAGISLGRRPVALAAAYDRSLAGQPGLEGVLGFSAFEGRSLWISSRARRFGIDG